MHRIFRPRGLLLCGLLMLSACQSTTASVNKTAIVSPASESAPVPASYQSLYGSLQTQLHTLEAQIAALPQQSPSAPIFGAHLLEMDSNRGPALLNPNTAQSVSLYLKRFQELGLHGITMSINYPLLMPTFPQSAQYLALYQSVVQQARQLGLTVAIEQGVLFTNTPFSPFHFSYAGLTAQSLAAQQHTMAQIIIDQLHPDFLGILEEPETVDHLTGLTALATPDDAVAYTQTVLSGLRRGQTLIGAGAGSWQPASFDTALIARTTLDVVPLHMYPVTPTTIATTLADIQAAQAARKPIVFDEAWLNKDTSSTIANSNFVQVSQRNLYSFFAPLDGEFLRDLVQLSRRVGIAYFSPFWSNYFFAQIAYQPADETIAYAQAQQEVLPLLGQNLLNDVFTAIGTDYQRAIQGGA